MADKKENHIIASWMQNAKPWIHTISHHEIESRIIGTNKAIVEAILKKKPRKVLDIGCGEGWLARALNTAGVAVTGIDIVPELVNEAKRLGGGSFQVLAYEELSADTLKERFDVIVCNFSLLGNESVSQVFQAVIALLNEDGYFIVQTVHPVSACGEAVYQDGWREGSWAGFNSEFTDAPPWYFRTLQSWEDLFARHNLNLIERLEPVHPETNTFLSVIFVGQSTHRPDPTIL